MTEDKKKIVDLFLEDRKVYTKELETEKFLYWINEEYMYNGKAITREEFEEVKDYVAKYHDVPATREIMKLDGGGEKFQRMSDYEIKGKSFGHSRVGYLRYSKTYDSLEWYVVRQEIKSPHRNRNSNKIVFTVRKEKKFKINDKNHVIIFGRRYLSLKNLAGCRRELGISEKLAKQLLALMIDADWVNELHEEEFESYMIENKHSRGTKSFHEALANQCGAKPAKLLKKMLGPNDLVKLYSVIDPNKVHSLTNFIKRNSENIKILMGRYNHQEKYKKLLFLYFLTRDNRCEEGILNDYVEMLFKEGEKINLNMTSYSTIKSKHDKISRKILRKTSGGGRLRVAKIYPNIKSLPGLEVEKIKSVDRLNRESEVLHHCVHGYKDRINRGDCAIYSLYFEGRNYTLQINAEKKPKPEEEELAEIAAFLDDVSKENSEEKKKGVRDDYNFRIAQLKGKFNGDAPERMRKVLETMCEKNELLPLSEARIRLKDYEPEDKQDKIEVKKYVHIGEDILDELVNYKRRNANVWADDGLPF